MLDVLSLSILCFNYVPALYWLYLLAGCHEMCFDDNSFSKRSSTAIEFDESYDILLHMLILFMLCFIDSPYSRTNVCIYYCFVESLFLLLIWMKYYINVGSLFHHCEDRWELAFAFIV